MFMILQRLVHLITRSYTQENIRVGLTTGYKVGTNPML